MSPQLKPCLSSTTMPTYAARSSSSSRSKVFGSSCTTALPPCWPTTSCVSQGQHVVVHFAAARDRLAGRLQGRQAEAPSCAVDGVELSGTIFQMMRACAAHMHLLLVNVPGAGGEGRGLLAIHAGLAGRLSQRTRPFVVRLSWLNAGPMDSESSKRQNSSQLSPNFRSPAPASEVRTPQAGAS